MSRDLYVRRKERAEKAVCPSGDAPPSVHPIGRSSLKSLTGLSGRPGKVVCLDPFQQQLSSLEVEASICGGQPALSVTGDKFHEARDCVLFIVCFLCLAVHRAEEILNGVCDMK